MLHFPYCSPILSIRNVSRTCVPVNIPVRSTCLQYFSNHLALRLASSTSLTFHPSGFCMIARRIPHMSSIQSCSEMLIILASWFTAQLCEHSVLCARHRRATLPFHASFPYGSDLAGLPLPMFEDASYSHRRLLADIESMTSSESPPQCSKTAFGSILLTPTVTNGVSLNTCTRLYGQGVVFEFHDKSKKGLISIAIVLCSRM